MLCYRLIIIITRVILLKRYCKSILYKNYIIKSWNVIICLEIRTFLSLSFLSILHYIDTVIISQFLYLTSGLVVKSDFPSTATVPERAYPNRQTVWYGRSVGGLEFVFTTVIIRFSLLLPITITTTAWTTYIYVICIQQVCYIIWCVSRILNGQIIDADTMAALVFDG